MSLHLGSDFKNINPVEVLLEYDGWQVFIFQDAGKKWLAYTSYIYKEERHLLVVMVDDSDIRMLKEGSAFIRSILDQPNVWKIIATWDDVILKQEILSDGIKSIGDKFLPTHDATIPT